MKWCSRQNRTDVTRCASSWIAGSSPAKTRGEDSASRSADGRWRSWVRFAKMLSAPSSLGSFRQNDNRRFGLRPSSLAPTGDSAVARMSESEIWGGFSPEHPVFRFAPYGLRSHHVSPSHAPSFRGSGRPAAFGGMCPPSEGAKRRQALVRNAAPGGLALRQSPSLQRKGTADP
jgi:hypothetical protein